MDRDPLTHTGIYNRKPLRCRSTVGGRQQPDRRERKRLIGRKKNEQRQVMSVMRYE